MEKIYQKNKPPALKVQRLSAVWRTDAAVRPASRLHDQVDVAGDDPIDWALERPAVGGDGRVPAATAGRQSIRRSLAGSLAKGPVPAQFLHPGVVPSNLLAPDREDRRAAEIG